MVKKRRYWIPIGKRFCGDFYRWNNYWADRTVNRSWSNQKFTFSTRTICQTWHFFRLNTFLSLRIEIAKIAVNVVKTQPREIVSEKDHKLWFIALLMAQWVDMEAEKSRTQRMLVRDQPTWGWFEATDSSDRTQRVKKHKRYAWFVFSNASMSTHWAIRRVQ